MYGANKWMMSAWNACIWKHLKTRVRNKNGKFILTFYCSLSRGKSKRRGEGEGGRWAVANFLYITSQPKKSYLRSYKKYYIMILYKIMGSIILLS